MKGKTESLKNRTKADMICSFVAAFVAIVIAVWEIVTYALTAGAHQKYLSNGIYAIFAFVIALLLGFILLEVHKMEKPFSKRIINELRALAVVVIFTGWLPDVITTIIVALAKFGASGQAHMEFVLSAQNVTVSVIGVVIGVISEIFVYGYELQDDIDSIA